MVHAEEEQPNGKARGIVITSGAAGRLQQLYLGLQQAFGQTADLPVTEAVREQVVAVERDIGEIIVFLREQTPGTPVTLSPGVSYTISLMPHHAQSALVQVQDDLIRHTPNRFVTFPESRTTVPSVRNDELAIEVRENMRGLLATAARVNDITHELRALNTSVTTNDLTVVHAGRVPTAT